MSAVATSTERWSFEALGTRWEVDGPLTESDRHAVTSWLDDFDARWSRFRDDSEVSALARSGGRLPLSPELAGLIDLYDVLGTLTGGAVSLLVGESLTALGYDASYSLMAGSPVPAPPRSTARREDRDLVLDAPALVDIGAAGKGLAVDAVLALLLAADRERRITVDASGDLRHHDPDPTGRPIRVALEDPHDRRRAVGVAELHSGAALAASAVNRRAWGEGLHHVLDARTGIPVDDVIATWVVADSTVVADGAATALFFADPADVVAALEPYGVRAAIRMTDLRRLERAGTLPGEVFT